jgi:UDP-N-acetyl-2-amino-2-deoxyglucuronate dehydrogenase
MSSAPGPLVRTVIVGCGRIGQRHASILAGFAGVELVAMADSVLDRAREFASRFGGRPHPNAESALAAHAPDLVVVCTPSGLHAEHVIAAAERGVPNIITEKPMALRLPDADAMIAACTARGAKLFVVQQNRYNPPIRKLREALETGRFGRLVMASVRVWWCRQQTYYDHDPWRGTWALDGGVFANQASHYLDMLVHTMGDVDSVEALTATRLAHIEAEDTGVAVLRFRNGALGVISATTAARPKDLEGSITILGEHGVAEIGGFAMNEVRRWTFDSPSPQDKEVEKLRTDPPDVYGLGHHAYLADVIRAIRSGGEPAIDGAEGRRSLELIAAIYESAASRSAVPLPCTVRVSRLGEKVASGRSVRL